MRFADLAFIRKAVTGDEMPALDVHPSIVTFENQNAFIHSFAPKPIRLPMSAATTLI
jgi:hypothetical protein